MESMFTYEMLEEMAAAYTTGDIIYTVTMNILAIVGYVLRSISLYTIAKRRGIANPWLAWVPVAWIWVLGSISDQFRYVTKAQVKNKRKTLLILNMVAAVLALVMLVFAVISFVDIFNLMMTGMEDQVMSVVLAIMLKLLAITGLLVIVSIVHSVVYYIAMYDLYCSTNPNNSVLFLVLDIFIRVAEPFFIFFNRKKDGGMPPRCNVPQEPVAYVEQPSYIPAAPVVEPVEPDSEESETEE